MRKRLLLLLLIFSGRIVAAAQPFRLLTEDSLLHLLAHQLRTASLERNSAGLEYLTRILPSNVSFDSVKNILISETEYTRDRSEMCRVNLGVAKAYLGYFLVYDYALKAKPFIERAQDIAEESGMDICRTGAMLQWTRFYISSTQYPKALDYNNRAVALALSTGSDSLIADSYSSLSYVNDYLGNRLSRLQALLSARNYADRSGITWLRLQNLLDLAVFYRDADQIEKSRDYYTMVVQEGTAAAAWNLVIDARRGLGMTYRMKQQKELALAAYDSAMVQAKKFLLKQEKISVTLDLLNFYFNEETPDKGLAYLAANPELSEFVKSIGIGYQINKVYAAKYEKKGNYDSALYYLNIAAPLELNQPQNFGEKYEFSRQWSRILERSGRRPESLQRLLMAKNYADSSGDLEKKRDVSLELDSAYLARGDYQNAFDYYSRYNNYRDTLETLGRQKDLINAEIEDAGKRAERDKIETENKLRRRDNLQYMAITAAIATLFIILIVLGVFRMSVSVIKALGFFSFIFLFEFIILLLDKQIHELTHGEPWKVLAIKIVVIAMLLPLHHYLEHRAFLFLTSRAHMLRKNFRGFQKVPAQENEPGAHV